MQALEGGRSGVHEALVKAVLSTSPLIIVAIVGQERQHFLMFPGSCVYDLYETCVRTGFASGDFVRAEDANEDDGSGRAISRDALLRDHRKVRIATNRRVIHQKQRHVPQQQQPSVE